jgi:hypothetical protein
MPFIKQARGLVSKPELRGLVADLVPTVPSLAALNDVTVPLLQQVRAASSCQNDVILPWTKLRIQDPNFPAKHDVAGEAPQPLVGLSGEGRSMSPNGYWFRVMLTTGNFVYDMGHGLLATTALPLLGTNPAKAQGRPPLRADVPCETQPVPNLKTTPGPAPQQVQSAATANPKAYQEMWEKLQKSGVKELRDAIDGAGLTKDLKVSSDPATDSDISGLASKLGHTAQLDKVQQLLQNVPLAGGAAKGAGK